jgi:TRAP-type mannitol/chloroaromatic compound transport system permease small subunit
MVIVLGLMLYLVLFKVFILFDLRDTQTKRFFECLGTILFELACCSLIIFSLSIIFVSQGYEALL